LFSFQDKNYYSFVTTPLFQFATVPKLSLFWTHTADPRSVRTTTGSSNRRRRPSGSVSPRGKQGSGQPIFQVIALCTEPNDSK